MESNGIARVKSVIRKQTKTAISKRPNDVDPTLSVDGKVTYCRLVVNEINSLPEPALKTEPQVGSAPVQAAATVFSRRATQTDGSFF
jgi:hypothetical protein